MPQHPVPAKQAKYPRVIPSILFAAALFVLVVVPFVYGREYPKSVASVFDDIVTFGRFSCLVGFLSDLGIVLWFAMSALLMHALHRRLVDNGKAATAEKAFYLVFALITLWLGLDDRLLIHEWLTYKGGIPEGLIMAVYAAVVLTAGWTFRRFLAAPGIEWLWIAFPCFIVSVGMDLFASNEVIEESFKWVGICALFLYIFVLTGVQCKHE